MIQEINVDSAAPPMPISGIGPTPNIRIGSSTAFMPPPVAIIMLGVLVSPLARNTLFPTMGIARNTEAKYQMYI